MAKVKQAASADGSVAEAVVDDQTQGAQSTAVQFGDDAWGQWATGVEERLGAIELQLSQGADVDAMRKELDELKATLSKMPTQNVGKGADKLDDGDTSARFARLEQALGIGAIQDVKDEKEERRAGATSTTEEGATLAYDADDSLKHPFAKTSDHSTRADGKVDKGDGSK